MLIMGRLYTLVGAGGMWEISVPFAQFDCEPKTILKNILLQNKMINV